MITKLKFPSIKEITDEIISYRDYLKNNFDPKDIEDEEGNAGGDCRLQVLEGCWQVHTGDSSYDTDHRGFWGASSVSIEATKKDCREIARDLIGQATEHYFESQD